MKNKEKYLDEILEAFTNIDGANGICRFKKRHVIKPEECSDISCNECRKRTREWLEQEYKELIKLTEDEKTILKNVDKQYEWIARNESGNIFIHYIKPIKSVSSGIWDNGKRFSNFMAFNHLFQFIKREDEEPYNIDELLKTNRV